jgi:anaerobic magnesium-protoporphyrin IX monomethyl ester cyclase
MPMMRLLENEIMEPLGLMFIASSLIREGIHVRIVDRRVELARNGYSLQQTNETFEDLLEKYRPDYVACTVNSVHVPDVRTIGEMVKKFPDIKAYLVGGVEATIRPEYTLARIDTADILFSGDGEIPLTRYLKGDLTREVEQCMLVKGKVRNIRPYREHDLSVLPYPFREIEGSDYYLTKDKNILVDYGRSLGDSSSGMAEVITSRGCNGHCRFCAVRSAVGFRMRFHSLDWVIGELKELIRNGIGSVYFNDDVFTVDRERTIELCERIIREDIHRELKWIAQSRVDAVDVELLSIMRAAGCVRIEYGFESGSEQVLKEMGKNIGLSEYYRVAEETNRVGITFQANVIYGYPVETKKSVTETITFLSNIDSDSVLLNVFSPVPGSGVWYELKQRGQLDDVDINGEWLPAHPCLARRNYTKMSDAEWVEHLLRLMEYAPEALSFYENNEVMFREVSEVSDGLLIYSVRD